MSLRRFIYMLSAVLMLFSCSVKKFIPEGGYLLSDVDIVSNTNKDNAGKAKNYVRQKPNAKWFTLVKLPMYTYALSGLDSTKWHNRVLRRLGEKPVVYSDMLAEATRLNIQQMLLNDGYLHAKVDLECEKNDDKRKAKAVYYLHERERYYVSDFRINVDDKQLQELIMLDTAACTLKAGMPFSVDGMEMERRRVTSLLKDNGYYRFQKEHITYTADTALHSNQVRLTMNIAGFIPSANAPVTNHKTYRIEKIYYVANAGLHIDNNLLQQCDTIDYGDYAVLYNETSVVRTKKLLENTYITPGELYSQSNIDRTYSSFSQLQALKYTTVRLQERPDTALLDCYIMYERNKRCSIGFDLDGTNTAGNFGAMLSMTMSDKNLFRGSEQLSLRFFYAYEAVSNLSGYTGDNYTEYGAELGFRLQGGVVSSLVPIEKRNLHSSTLFSLKYNSQDRPEFNRRLISGTWSYEWSRQKEVMHKVDVLELNYIYVPWIAETFKKEYLDSISNRNSILKYNYENLLITKLGYNFSYNSSLNDANRFKRAVFSVRTNVECSGNLLYGATSLFNTSKNSDGQYTFLNIAYAQYVKGDIDFTTRVKFDDKNSVVMHLGLGVAYPYGNSRILPFEKRYFMGGANSMRGWTVRTLGPGSYRNGNRNIDFINQSGDLKLDMSVEFRSHLFWMMHTALFVDAGNIWTIREYSEQPGGQFNVATFYKEIALSYGLGLRLEFDMFVFRLDAAMKAINPAYTGREKYPIINPKFSRDFALHFAIGYPF
ncbi:MAG: BamA/TamA family outer membrane protein [Bacteroidaceae bacterium]|nr:BamA/TamA family outer membrane protein [Bacteroidaceae bacterium]